MLLYLRTQRGDEVIEPYANGTARTMSLEPAIANPASYRGLG
jgi:hypothetical protein